MQSHPIAATPSNLEQARAFMDAHLDAPLDLAQLAALAHFSPYHFIRVFHKTFHETPYQYLIRKRLEKAKALNVTRFLENCAVVELTAGAQFSKSARRTIVLQ